MSIKGVTNVSLIDWDNEVCSTLFLGGCNLRCKFCQNSQLVLSPHKITTMETEEILKNLKAFRNYLTSVCITGGEPLLNRLNLIPLFKNIKDMGLKIKLDTNGFYPYILDYYIRKELIDYIAMDIKAPLTTTKYSRICGKRLNIEKLALIQKSIDSIREFGNYEFRTTVVPTFHTIDDIEDICKYAINGSNRYVIQNFRSCDTLIKPSKCPSQGFSQGELEDFANVAQKFVREVKIRNYNQNP